MPQRAPYEQHVRLSRPVLTLGAIAFASMLCEGASADWASVYLRGSIHVGAAAAGLGYTGFALMMVLVRLSGNRLLSRFRRERLLPALAAVATVGFHSLIPASLTTARDDKAATFSERFAPALAPAAEH